MSGLARDAVYCGATVLLLFFLAVPAEEEFKCLQCEKTKELMCYTNQTCPEPSHTYCYYRQWSYEADEFSPDNNTREWGCSATLATCQKDSQGCDRSQCCFANVDFAGNPDLNMTQYKACIYGIAGARGLGVSGVLVVLGLVLAS